MAEVNLHSWPEISQASEGLQLNSTAATWEYIHARLTRLETRLVEHKRKVAATLPPLQPEPDPPGGPPLYTIAQQQFQITCYQPPPPISRPLLRPPPNPPNGQPWNYVQPRPNQQVPTYGLVSAYDPELYRHQFNPPAAPQPPYTYMNSHALLRSPYDGPQNPPLPPYKPDRDQLHHDHQPIDYQQLPLTAGAAANLPHQNYQPVGQQRCTRKPPLDWPQPPPQHSPSCWCPPTATPLPTVVVPISTPANGFVEIQHLPCPPEHAQFQIFGEPISDSSDVEMLIMEEVRTEELPPIECGKRHENRAFHCESCGMTVEKYENKEMARDRGVAGGHSLWRVSSALQLKTPQLLLAFYSNFSAN
ncbi:hypothetical protein SASPL_133073 [Salvia splendens]|uniref:Uncharacterized protein n=1 Tax=Salvia splendens TaxID=180675 RepID=A0A8X8X4E1_SALSN|nr:hypothetical protein SASPL_133073 [Salvia splendens]